MNAYVRLLICAVIGTAVVLLMAWIQVTHGSQSTTQLVAIGMIAVVLAWIATGMKRPS